MTPEQQAAFKDFMLGASNTGTPSIRETWLAGFNAALADPSRLETLKSAQAMWHICGPERQLGFAKRNIQQHWEAKAKAALAAFIAGRSKP